MAPLPLHPLSPACSMSHPAGIFTSRRREDMMGCRATRRQAGGTYPAKHRILEERAGIALPLHIGVGELGMAYLHHAAAHIHRSEAVEGGKFAQGP